MTHQIHSKQSFRLAPDYRLAGVITVGSLPLSLISPWVTVVILGFGCFLITQAASLQVVFTDASLQVYRTRGQTESKIRDFPYCDWINWRIFYPGVPILFYFREVNSIHFLPILFDPQQLQHCLKAYVGEPALLAAHQKDAQQGDEADATTLANSDRVLDGGSHDEGLAMAPDKSNPLAQL